MRVAQLDRASGYGPEGREFESSSARHEKSNCVLQLLFSFILVSLDVELNPRFYRGKKSERSDNRKGELDTSRKTLKREEPPV